MLTETFRYDDDGPYLFKDPDAVLDYVFDWTDWLDSDTISVAPTFTVTNGTKVSQSNTTTKATVFVSGGAVGQTISVACKIVTTGGRTDERTIRLKVVSR